ncbi:MAG: endonuclease/exonuclease/phosphatase family protein [Clostridiales Family XIII bacterium]|nr:endonuclease/exonuclease/phosphatase family protein [Clostridiales Family XIII bacterium]
MHAVKLSLKIVLCTLIVLILIVAAYVLYVVLNYERIPDDTALDVGYSSNPLSSAGSDSESGWVLETGKEYKALTFNIGFGAYDRDFSFFMDEGVLSDGATVVGSMSRAASRKAVERSTASVIGTALAEDPDITIFQEVDTDADRSHRVNQTETILNAYLSAYLEQSLSSGRSLLENLDYYTYAKNFHTAYLFYPPTKPIGFIKDSGLLTVSRYRIDSAVRRSYPVSDAFPTKFFDLDRCFVVNRMPVQGADGIRGELVFINTHMSAYDKGGTIRRAQMELLAEIIEGEYKAGNWVIVGGDFNHALGGSEYLFNHSMGIPPWVQPFDESFVPDGFTMLSPDNLAEVATVRDTSIPYERGYNFEVVLDGFMISDNISATTHNIDADYDGSDHNPVLMKFTLK